jgi:serine protease Do
VSRRAARSAAGAAAAGLLCGLVACTQPPTQDARTADRPSLAELVRVSSLAVVGIGAGSAQAEHEGVQVVGSGFRLHGTGLVATAAHVVSALRGPALVVWNGRHWPARVVRVDGVADLALLEVDAAAPMPGLVLSSARDAAPGDWVLVLGCPFGTLPTATMGIVSALPGAVLRPEALRQRMQLNAAVNPGNSGGPVIGLDGKVIAVANATVSGGYGLGFAVPVAALSRLLEAGDARR